MDAEFKEGLPRSVEALMALGGLVATAPVLAAAAAAVKLSSPGPILFCQERVGRFGRSFTLYKFRSMRVQNTGPQITAKGDSRVTAVGKLLRKTKIDELPGLWNVVRGDLSLVGPRPEVPKYVDLKNPLWQKVLSVRPGITDTVTLRLRNEEELLASAPEEPAAYYSKTLLPYKLRGYVEYLEQRSWRSDVEVLVKTALAVVVPGRAPPPTHEEVRAKVADLKITSGTHSAPFAP